MRLSDLRDKEVKTLDGKTLGRIHDVHADDGKVIALMCGLASFVERLTAKKRGRRIAWERVARVEADAVIVADERSAERASASRSRRGTRRPTARRSKR